MASLKGSLARATEKAKTSLTSFSLRPMEWRVVCLIWILLLLAIGVLGITAPLAGWRMDTVPDDIPRHLTLVVSIMSVIFLGASYFLRRLATGQTRRGTRAASFKPLCYMYLMSLALSVPLAVAISGLVVYYFEGDLLSLSLFIAISIVALLLLRPREKDLLTLGD